MLSKINHYSDSQILILAVTLLYVDIAVTMILPDTGCYAG